jgi:hypothetical protein
LPGTNALGYYEKASYGCKKFYNVDIRRARTRTFSKVCAIFQSGKQHRLKMVKNLFGLEKYKYFFRTLLLSIVLVNGNLLA